MERTPYTERHADAPRAEHPRAGELGLALGCSGLLYQEGVRAMVGTALQPWTLVGYEASFAMHRALSAVRKYFDGRRAERLRRSARSLWELRENRDGLTLPELCEPRLRDEDEVLRAVEELEHKGELVRRRGEDGSDVFALTERGQLVFDGHLRHKAEAERPLLEDLPPGAARADAACVRAGGGEPRPVRGRAARAVSDQRGRHVQMADGMRGGRRAPLRHPGAGVHRPAGN